MEPETYRYYVTWAYRIPPMASMFGCREVKLDGPMEEDGRRVKLAAQLAVEFQNLVILDWKRIS